MKKRLIKIQGLGVQVFRGGERVAAFDDVHIAREWACRQGAHDCSTYDLWYAAGRHFVSFCGRYQGGFRDSDKDLDAKWQGEQIARLLGEAAKLGQPIADAGRAGEAA